MSLPDSATRPRVNGRQLACGAIELALAGGGFVRDHLEKARRADGLDAREAALAAEIALGAIRHSITIRQVLSAVARFDARRTQPPLIAILYAAAYQIIWMDRIPIFAAVDEAVSLGRRCRGAKAGGMINAILRKLAAAISERRTAWRAADASLVRADWDCACAFSRPVLPDPQQECEHLAAAAGERVARMRYLIERFGVSAAERTTWASQAQPVLVLQRNTQRIDAAGFAQRVASEFGGDAASARPPSFACDGRAAFLPAGTAIAESTLFRDGLAYVQDLTARSAAVLVSAQPDERILDLCAAPGGKSIALALAMQDRGEIVACDVSRKRLRRITENTSRLQLSCIKPQLIEPNAPEAAPTLADFDAALVDAPCSNTGVIARRPEARLSLTQKKLYSLVALQSQLMRAAAARVRPGGRLVYSTCSIEREENEQIVASLLRERNDWRLEHEETTLPTWGPQLSDWRDGGYAARLRKSGG